jgi:hypothetical protein
VVRGEQLRTLANETRTETKRDDERSEVAEHRRFSQSTVAVTVALDRHRRKRAKVMAKSSRRKKQDRANVETRHADEARQRDRAEAVRQADGLLDRAIDLALSPAALTALIMDGLTDWTGTGFIAYARLQRGAPPATLAETSRLLLAACSDDSRPVNSGPATLPSGVLAFAAVAAHANGEEEEERRCMEALLEPARATGANRPLLEGAWDVLTWTHPAEAAEMTRRYLLDHPQAYAFATALAKVDAKRDALASPDVADVAALIRLGDPSSPRFARRLTDRLSQRSGDDPSILARYQADAKAEFLARRGVPLWASRAMILAKAERHMIPLD